MTKPANKEIECLQRHANILINSCANVKKDEKVLLILDDSTREIEKFMLTAVKLATKKFDVIYIPTSNMHGIEPPNEVAFLMESADIILAATKYSLAHTQARFRATNRGARYLSLPQYGLNQLNRESLEVDFLPWAEKGQILKNIFDNGSRARIKTNSGTDISLNIEDRIANWAPGFCNKPGMLGSPPDIETNIAPIENKSNGVIVVDGSIPCESIGLLTQSIKITVKDGFIENIENNDSGFLLSLLLEDKNSPKRVLAELGVGLNPKARLCGLMLEDEGCLGTLHFGFGSNATIGGNNNINFHLDLVIKNPFLKIDDKLIIENGVLLI